MKVLYVAHCTDMSGANKSLVQLIVELRDNYGVEPFVLYPVVGQNEEWSIADALKENHIEGLSHKLICFQRKEHSISIQTVLSNPRYDVSTPDTISSPR